MLHQISLHRLMQLSGQVTCGQHCRFAAGAHQQQDASQSQALNAFMLWHLSTRPIAAVSSPWACLTTNRPPKIELQASSVTLLLVLAASDWVTDAWQTTTRRKGALFAQQLAHCRLRRTCIVKCAFALPDQMGFDNKTQTTSVSSLQTDLLSRMTATACYTMLDD
jgi:hypothetical protein